MRLRGFHSNSSSSTARSTAAIGVSNVADIPPAAPATSSVLRSAAVRWKTWAMIDPSDPPVMMIGPSAPNGPPEPIEMADEIGLSTRHLGRHPALADQDRLHRLGDAVPADALRAVPRHQADDQSAGDRHEHRQPAQRVGGRQMRAETELAGNRRDS